jgi:AcrR family transcriptional regulator
MSSSTRSGCGHAAKYDDTPQSDARRHGTRPSRIGDVVEAAILLFGDRGVEKVTVEDIAAEAGLVPRAVYYHFATKDEVMHAAFARVRDEVDVIVADATDLDSAVRETFAWGRANPQRAQLLWVHSVGATPAMFDLWNGFITRHVDATQRYRGESADILASGNTRTNWLAARTAVIAGTLMQLYWGSGDLIPNCSSEDVAVAVAAMFRSLIEG